MLVLRSYAYNELTVADVLELERMGFTFLFTPTTIFAAVKA